MDSYFLYFDSDDIAHIEKKNVKDGFATISEKNFFVNQARPFMYKTGLGIAPLYIVKWDQVSPSNTLQAWGPSWEKHATLDPSALKKAMDLKILGNMLKVNKPPLSPIVMVLLGLAMGGFVAYYLIAMKVVKLQ